MHSSNRLSRSCFRILAIPLCFFIAISEQCWASDKPLTEDPLLRKHADLIRKLERGGVYIHRRKQKDGTHLPGLAAYVIEDDRETKDEDVELLKKLPNVREVAFGGGLFTDRTLHHLAALPDLEYLYLKNYSSYTDGGLKVLRQCKKLKRLELVDYFMKPPADQLTDRALDAVSGIPSLRILKVSGNGFRDDGLKHLSQLSGLVSLSVWGEFTAAGMKHLGQLKNLKHLTIDKSFANDGVAALGPMAKLEELQIGSDDLTDDVFQEFARFPRLRHLKVRSNGISGRGLKDLAGLKSLEVLELEQTTVSDDGLATLSGPPSLRRLNLSFVKLRGSRLSRLKSLTGLRELILDNTLVDNDGVAQLSQVTQLTSLSLMMRSRSPRFITHRGVAHLVALVNLESLTLDYNPVTDRAVPYLKSMPKLRYLSLRETRVTAKGRAELREILPKLKIHWTSSNTGDPLPDCAKE